MKTAELAKPINKNLRKLSNVFSFSLLLKEVAAILAVLIGMLMMALYRGIWNIKSDNSNVYYDIINLLSYFTYMFVPFAITSAILRQNPLKTIPFKFKNKNLIPASIAIGLFLSIVGEFYSSYFDYLLSFFGLKVKLDAFNFPNNTPALIVYAISISIFAPICEEFIFRGLIMQNLRKYGNFFAVLISSLLFAVLHGNFSQTPFAFLVGIALGFSVIETGSILTGIIIHCLINSISIAIDGIAFYYGDELANVVNLSYMAVVFLLCIAAVIYLIKKMFFRGIKERYFSSEIQSSSAFSIFVMTPGFITFLIVYILNMLFTLSSR